MLTFALLSLAALVSADRTFSLTAKGEKFEHHLEITNGVLGFRNDGPAATFTLEEPSGYLAAEGKYVVLGPDGAKLSTQDKSRAFGVQDGKLRSGTQTKFLACPSGAGYKFMVSGSGKGCVNIDLFTENDGPSSTGRPHSTITDPVPNPMPFTPAPSPFNTTSARNTTETRSHTLTLTITSCDDECTSTPVHSISTYVAGAAQAGAAAGAAMVAAALLL